jgi:DNA-binding NarL/FixJ family response regulator
MLNPDCCVLIADDDEYFRLILASLLRGPLGFSTVVEAGSLDEALERLSEISDKVGLALFDLAMPGMEGPGTLAAVRKYYPDVRAAVVSASRSRQDVLMSLETGVHGYIPKGFGPLELVRALKVVIAGDIFVPALIADVAADHARQTPVGSGRISHGTAPSRSPMARSDGATDLGATLSPRQWEVLALVVKGYSNKQIANTLKLGEGTVKIHAAALMRNLGVLNRAGAAAAGVPLLSTRGDRSNSLRVPG